MEDELESQYMNQYGHGPVGIDDVSVKNMDVAADQTLEGDVELPEGDYSLERRQTDFEDGRSAVEYRIEGPEYVSVQASLAPDESFATTDNYEVTSTVGELSKDQVRGLWSDLRSQEESDLMAGFSELD